MPFQYRPYQNRYVGTITDLMGRGRDAEAQALIDSANAQARAAQVSGQAWGGAIQGIGNTIAAIPGQMQAGQDREMALADRARVIDQQEREDVDRANQDRAAALYASRITGDSQDPLANTVGFRPTHGAAAEQDQHPYQVKQDGGWVFDIEAFRQAAAEAGPGVLGQIEPYAAQMESMNNMRRSVVELGRAEARNQATWLTALPDEKLLQALPFEIRGFEGVLDQGLLDSLTGLVEQGDAVGIRSVLNAYIGKQSQFVSTRPGETTQDITTGRVIEGQTTAPAPEGPPITVSRDGRNVLVQRYDDGSLRDLPQGIEPAIDDSQGRRLVPVYDSAGNRVYGEPQAGQRVVEPTGRPMTSGDANRISELDTSLDDIAVLSRTLFPDAIGADVETEATTGTLAAVGAALPNWLTEIFGWGEDAKGRQAVIDRVKQVIGKALEGGVLRKEDEYKYTKILPTIKDTPEVARVKLEGLKDALTLRRERLLEGLDDAGYNVSEFYARGLPAGGIQMLAPDGVELLTVAPGDVGWYESRGATRVR
jgi:hypothetical protein